MTGGQRIIEAIRRLAETTEIVTGEGLEEVWLGQRAYDAVSLELLERKPVIVGDKGDRWLNGLLIIYCVNGEVIVRRKY